MTNKESLELVETRIEFTQSKGRKLIKQGQEFVQQLQSTFEQV